jgi:lipopolysaccharide export system permease protein
MVFTLHRYILRELMKVFVLATLALTGMMSIGSILRPVQEYGVGPGQVLNLMCYFLPITLTFVLPIAALFACALVYGRFANDNEIDACKASGISVMSLIYPGLTLAVVVAIANLILGFYVMPAFVQRAEKAVKSDAKQIIFRNIQRKGYYKPPGGKYLIYADYADMKTNTLSGVVIVNFTNGRIQKLITTESANVTINSQKRSNEIVIDAYETYQMGAEDKNWIYFERLPITAEFPSIMGDDIRFKKIDKMKEIQAEPLEFSPTEKLAWRTYLQYITELITADIDDSLSVKTAGVDNSGYKVKNNEKEIVLSAQKCSAVGERKIEFTGDVVADEFTLDGHKLVRKLRANKATIYIEDRKPLPNMVLEFQGARALLADGAEELAGRVIIRDLILPEKVADNLHSDYILGDLEPKAVKSSLGTRMGSNVFQTLHNKLWYEVRGISSEITVEINSRLVFGVGCIPMILIGIGLGILKKGGHLLSAFGISCIPAAVLVVCIMMGKNIANSPKLNASIGIMLIWLGVVMLIGLMVAVYRKLLRN